MNAEAGIGTGLDWREALDEALGGLPALAGSAGVDLALLFASADYAADYAELLAAAQKALGARCLIGCSGQGVIGRDREVEHEPAISVLAFSLPGVELHALHLEEEEIEDEAATAALIQEGVEHSEVKAWLLFADPFSFDADRLLALLVGSYPGAPLVGGLASGDFGRQQTFLFLGGQVFDQGAVALAIGGPYRVQTVVSQGAEPIGETWTITSVQGNLVETLGMRPAVDILLETFRALTPETQERARTNLLVGLAMDEYRDEFGRGDFLIRNLMGIDRERGAIAIGAMPRVGQTLQFQLRDPAAADADLVELLGRAKSELAGQTPAGALLCSCNGRGIGLFGAPDHDARTVSEILGPLPLAGFFCNGEIGPVGGKPFLHGFTASIALILPA